MNTPKTDAVTGEHSTFHGVQMVSADFARQLETQVQELRETLESIKGCADALIGLQPNIAQMNKICAISNLARVVLERTAPKEQP